MMYFDGMVNSDWTNPGNWNLDSHDNPAGRIPVNGEDVYICADVDGSGMSPINLTGIYCYDGYSLSYLKITWQGIFYIYGNIVYGCEFNGYVEVHNPNNWDQTTHTGRFMCYYGTLYLSNTTIDGGGGDLYFNNCQVNGDSSSSLSCNQNIGFSGSGYVGGGSGFSITAPVVTFNDGYVLSSGTTVYGNVEMHNGFVGCDYINGNVDLYGSASIGYASISGNVTLHDGSIFGQGSFSGDLYNLTFLDSSSINLGGSGFYYWLGGDLIIASTDSNIWTEIGNSSSFFSTRPFNRLTTKQGNGINGSSILGPI